MFYLKITSFETKLVPFLHAIMKLYKNLRRFCQITFSLTDEIFI